MPNPETVDPTAAIEVFARLLCTADIHVYGDEHPTWQKLSRKVQDDYRKAARWLLPRMTVATRPAAVSVPPPVPRADNRATVLREAANALAAVGLEDSLVSGPRAWAEAIETLRRMAGEMQLTTCPHDPDRHGPEAGCVECRCTSTTGHTTDAQRPVGPCVAGEQQNETPEARP